MKTIKLETDGSIPVNFTGIVEREYISKEWFKEGEYHREDGPAIEYVNGHKEWWIDGKVYFVFSLNEFIEQSVFLGKEKGKYDLYWFKFLTEGGVKEFPIISGMNENVWFEDLFKSLDKETVAATTPQ